MEKGTSKSSKSYAKSPARPRNVGNDDRTKGVKDKERVSTSTESAQGRKGGSRTSRNSSGNNPQKSTQSKPKVEGQPSPRDRDRDRPRDTRTDRRGDRGTDRAVGGERSQRGRREWDQGQTRGRGGRGGRGRSDRPRDQESTRDSDKQAPETEPLGNEDESKDAPIDESSKHPIESSWTFWFDKRMRRGKPVTGGTVLTPVPLEDYQSNLKQVGTFKAVEDFWSLYHHMMPPSQLELNSNYHLFKTSIQPMWEDPANHKGGKWTIRIPSRERHNTNACWRNVLLAMVGEMLDAEEDDDVCGAVFSRRRGGDRISLWTRKQDRSKILTFGHRLRDVVTADLFGTPVSPTTGTTSSATTAATFDFVYDYHDDAIQNAQGPHIPGTGENPRSRYPRQISLE